MSQRMSAVAIGMALVVGFASVNTAAAQTGSGGVKFGGGIVFVPFSHHFRYRLLLSSQIQQEINLSDDQKTQIKAWGEVLKQENAAKNDQVKAAPAELREAKEKELRQQLEEQRTQRLTTMLQPEQLERLDQLGLRMLKFLAFEHEATYDRLKLTEEQRQQVRAVVAERIQRISQLPAASTPQLAAVRLKRYREIDVAALEKTLAVLTPEQREFYNTKMLGPEFTVNVSLVLNPDQIPPKKPSRLPYRTTNRR